jgi:hypothetical protein
MIGLAALLFAAAVLFSILWANTAAICNSFKREIFNGEHQFGSPTLVSRTSLTAPTTDSFKAALFLVTATINKATTAYSTTGELAGTGGYTQGGVAVTNGTAPTLSTDTAVWTPTASFQWTSFTSSGAFDACLIYNSTQSNKSVAVYTFGSTTITAGTFTLTMPANSAGTALLNIA